MAWCLIKNKANELKQAIANGSVNIYELKDMTSSQRREYFKKWVSEADAKQINIEYEKQLVKKNYERAMVSWAKKITGMNKQAKRDLQTRIQNMIARNELTADNADQKMEELINYRLGAEITPEQANKLFELSNKVKEQENWETDKERLEYGKAVYDLNQYAVELGTVAPKTKAKYYGQVVLDALSLPRSLMASMDLSALFGQGLWMSTSKEFYQSALGLNGRQSIFKQAFSEQAYERTMADIMTRDNYDLAIKSGLRITQLNGKLSQREETFISSIAEKIPGIGKLIRGSDRAYSGFLNQLRMDTYDRLINDAKLSGEDVRPGSRAAVEAAYITNNMTGAGNWRNKRTVDPIFNTVFFSPRRTMSMINNLNPATYVTLKSQTIRQFALARLISFAGVVAAIGGLAKLWPEDEMGFETDIRSANFGKLKISRRWYDITGGHARFLNALWTGVIGGAYKTFGGEDKLLFGKKNSETGSINPVGDGEYDTNAGKEIMRFIRNKTAPIPGFLWGMYTGEDYKGDKFEWKKELAQMFIPMSTGDILELNNGTISGQEALAGLIPNIFGINSYISTNIPDWHNLDTQEMKKFRAKVSEEQLIDAEKMYGKLYTERLEELVKDERYQKLDNEGKRKKLTELRKKVKQAVMKRILRGS